MIMFVNRDNLTKSMGWKYPYVSGPTQAFPGVFRPQPTNFRDSCRTLTYSRRSSVRLRSAGISWGASPRRLATSCGTSFRPDVPAFGTFTGPAPIVAAHPRSCWNVLASGMGSDRAEGAQCALEAALPACLGGKAGKQGGELSTAPNPFSA